MNAKNGALIYLLHALFAHTKNKKMTRDKQGKKKLIKYEIKDSHDSFIEYGKYVGIIQQHLRAS
jgi:hypothetical protein